MEGLIKNAMSYTPALHTIDPEKETVQGQVGNILKSGSPLLTDARTRAKQEANRRGLINSSMAVGEGEKAVIQTALPIAQQDAASYLSTSQRNQDATNRSLEFGAGAENQFRLQKLQGDQAVGLQELRGQQESQLMAQKAEIDKQLQAADAATREKLLQQQGAIDRQLQELRGQQETGLQQLRGTQEMELQQLRGEQSKMLAELDAQNKQLLQSNQSASQFFAQISASIGDILKEPNIGVSQKQQLVQKQIDLLRNGLTVIGSMSNLDLSGLLDLPETPLEPAPAPPANALTQKDIETLRKLIYQFHNPNPNNNPYTVSYG